MMRLTNTELLSKKINESGLKLGYIAEKLGISRPSLNRKLAGETRFWQNEIVILADLLRLSDREIRDIFLS